MNTKVRKPAICYEFGLDESFLVGTKEQLTNLANNILELLSSEEKFSNIYDIATHSPKCEEGLTEPMSEVVLDGILVVQSEEDKRKLINKIRTLSGDLPIDWEGYDKS